MSKMWGGRFNKGTDALTDDFNSSISFDQRLYKQDIKGSIAHAKMLGKQGIISVSESELIVKTLGEILEDIEAGKIEFSIDMEDIHMNIESHTPGALVKLERNCILAAAVTIRLPPICVFTLRTFPWSSKDLIRALGLTLLDMAKTYQNHHAGLHASAAGPAHHLRPPPDGLC